MSFFTRWIFAKATEPRHFFGQSRLYNVRDVTAAEFDTLFPGAQGVLAFPYATRKNPTIYGRRLVGVDESGTLRPVQRVVAYDSANAGRTVCGGRCRNAKGPSCDCVCGGENHGIDIAKAEWDESAHPRGKTTPDSTPGSFAPKATMEGTKAEQRGFVDFAAMALPAMVSDALTTVARKVMELGARVLGMDAQPGVDTKEALLSKAHQAQPEFENWGRKVAEVLGADIVYGNEGYQRALDATKNGRLDRPIVLIASMKDPNGQRFDQKVRDEYGGDYAKLKDVVRGTVIVPAHMLDDALQAMELTGIPFATPVKDRVNQPLLEGYRDIKLNPVMPSGFVTEMQVMTPAMFHAKNVTAHALYEENRVIYAKLSKGEPLTPAETQIVETNTYRQRAEVYDPAWLMDLQVAA